MSVTRRDILDALPCRAITHRGDTVEIIGMAHGLALIRHKSGGTRMIPPAKIHRLETTVSA